MITLDIMSLNKIKKLALQKYFQIFLLIFITFASYFNILQNNFAWDDNDFILNWESIRSFEYLPLMFTGNTPKNHIGVYRPIRGVIYIFSYKLWGTNPFGYHLQAILVHTLIVLLVYLIISYLNKKTFFAFAASLLFAVHPIHTEAISFTTASFDTFGILFFFLSFYLYQKSRNGKENILISKIGSYLYAALAFFTYEMTLILPLLIILYDYCFNKSTIKHLLKNFKQYLIYFSILLVYIIIRFFVLDLENRGDLMGGGYQLVSAQARLATPEILLHYIKWLTYPYNLTVTHQIPLSFVLFITGLINKIGLNSFQLATISNFYFLFPIFFITTLLFATLRLFKKNKIIIFCVAWFLVALLPAINIFEQGAIRAERFLYIPSFGFLLFLTYFFYKALDLFQNSHFRKILPTILIFLYISLIGFYSITTYVRNQDWKNEKSIWISYLKINPDSAFANTALGLIYLKDNATDGAISFFKKALITDKENPKVHYNLAFAYEQRGEIELAIDEYKKTIYYQPKYVLSYLRLGDLYEKQGNLDAAVSEYKTALGIDPNQAFIHHNLGLKYEKQDMPDEALKEYIKTIELEPKRVETYNNIGIIYGKKGEFSLAIESFKKSLTINPNNYKTYFNLGFTFEQTGDIKAAISAYQKGLDINPQEARFKEKLEKIITEN